ncbi:hypothetical protein AB0J74_35405 [Asanoa sp. NPDC049573]|uniref:hypothetical protein n=1 Tax=Asanoa sp. NPDC049573 TaxID=3155396 RepID=UPI003445006B
MTAIALLRRMPSRRFVSVAAIALALAAAGIVLWFQRADSGVQACERIASGNASLTAIRPMFAASRHNDLRNHGTRMIDAAHAYANPETGLDAWERLDSEMNIERQAVQAACADHGVTVKLV